MSKHLTRARSSECIFLHPTERRTERNGREEDEDENEDGDFDFQPPTPSEPLPHRGAAAAGRRPLLPAQRERGKRESLISESSEVLHCTAAIAALHSLRRRRRRPKCEHFSLPPSLSPAIVPIPLAKLRRVLRISPRLAVLFARTNTQYPSERECHGQPRANQ